MQKQTAVFVHGWDTSGYNKNATSKDVYRPKLLHALEEIFDLKFCALPGFYKSPEPEESERNVENFSDYLANYILKMNPKPTVLIGYSFGGAVVLDYKTRYKSSRWAIIIAPALKRKVSYKTTFIEVLRKYLPLNSTYLKHIYLLLTNKYYRQGSSFLRKSYDKIVRRDLSQHLLDTPDKKVLLIQGDKDSDVPFALIKEAVLKSEIHYEIIPEGNHNIGNTHTEQIIKIIEKHTK